MLKIMIFLVLFYSMFFYDVVLAKTKCVKAKGKVQCNSDKQREADVEIYLMDRDTLNPDDTMGYTTTNEDGTFTVEGCGYDFGPWNNPDPFLKIWSYCGTYTGRRIDTNVKQVFTPEIIDFGVLNLD